jgi:hypothetical protein
MATSPTQGGEAVPEQPSGTDVDALGPSDSSDSGSDVRHERRMPTAPDTPDELGAVTAHVDSTSDALGTGERASAAGDAEGRSGADIVPDRADQLASDTDVEADAQADLEREAPRAQAGERGDAQRGERPARASDESTRTPPAPGARSRRRKAARG